MESDGDIPSVAAVTALPIPHFPALSPVPDAAAGGTDHGIPAPGPAQLALFTMWITCLVILAVWESAALYRAASSVLRKCGAMRGSRGKSRGGYDTDEELLLPRQERGRPPQLTGADCEAGDADRPRDSPEQAKRVGARPSAWLAAQQLMHRLGDGSKGTLRDVVVLGAIAYYMYACDVAKLFPDEDRVYNRDTFIFILISIGVLALATLRKSHTDKLLHREQTEEWKGWMQIIFVLYHYFAAKEIYNPIRIFIACYVWMTGFGNFSFFWIRKDFTLLRVCRMLFRLNFLVIVVATAVGKRYMVYYICAMHTYWFFSVYAMMRVGASRNNDDNRRFMAAKFAAYFVCNAAMFGIPGLFDALFSPFTFLLGLYDDPNGLPLHEWKFRATLDHWMTFVGMLCAYNHPTFEALMKKLTLFSADNWTEAWELVSGAAEKPHPKQAPQAAPPAPGNPATPGSADGSESAATAPDDGRKKGASLRVNGVGAAIARDGWRHVTLVGVSLVAVWSVIAAVFAVYASTCLVLPKLDFNEWHPYTAWMPILVYIPLRNATPWLRAYHSEVLAWLGKITLETYLAQSSIWLRQEAKRVIVYIPGYPLVNFALSTAIYIVLSKKLFDITGSLSSALLPDKGALRNVVCCVVAFAAYYFTSLAYIMEHGWN